MSKCDTCGQPAKSGQTNGIGGIVNAWCGAKFTCVATPVYGIGGTVIGYATLGSMKATPNIVPPWLMSRVPLVADVRRAGPRT